MSYRRSEASCVLAFRVQLDVREDFTRYRKQHYPDKSDSELLRSMLEKQLKDAGDAG